MRRWAAIGCLAMLVVAGASRAGAQAESNARLDLLKVQLWPEFDQPSMLVLYDFELAAAVELPALVTFRIPDEANLIAVAFSQDDALVNAPFEGPVEENGWQAFTVTVSSQARYRIEYYQPLELEASQRTFTYTWDGSLPVNQFSVEVLEPPDVSRFTSEPALNLAQTNDGPPVHSMDPIRLTAGEQFTLALEYEKTSNLLTAPASDLQPASPVDADTVGRVSLEQYLPYVLGGAGLVVLLGGVAYYAFSSRRPDPRRRRRPRREPEADAGPAVYCPQCGARAQAGDRFCRVCGTRLET